MLRNIASRAARVAPAARSLAATRAAASSEEVATYTLPEGTFTTHRTASEPNSEVSVTKEEMVKMYDEMYRIRRMETEANTLYKAKEIRGFCHLYNGQESCLVGAEASLGHDDAIITAYRDHGTALLRGVSVKGVIAELMGRVDGCAKGKGGSMHMYNKEGNFYGGHGIVGAQGPLGTGLALALKHQGKEAVSVTYYGDGAANQGQLFEGYNLAALLKLPAVFVCENNGYAMGTQIDRHAASTDFYSRGDFVPGIRVNGHDVLAVREAMRFAKEQALSGEGGPVIVEMKTYRYFGHSMSDPGTSYRTRDEVSHVRKTNDCINIAGAKIVENGWMTEKELKAMEKKISKEVKAEVKEAIASPVPHPDAVVSDVFAGDEVPAVIRMPSKFFKA